MSDQFRLRWPVDNPRITQYFGENPQIYAKFNQAGHEGVDFGVPVGSSIYAAAAGEVIDIRPNDGNPYGLNVRLQHKVGDSTYQTIYAHLSKSLVSKGQMVKAGEKIALSGNTGHSFGPHLHLTLKLIGAKTPGYPDGVIDPLPYLRDAPPPPSDLTIYATEQVRLRSGPTTDSAHLGWINKGEALIVLGDANAARAKVGQQGQWIQVLRAGGTFGYVAAWYTQLQPLAAPAPSPTPVPPEPPPGGALTVYATEALNVRNGPSVSSSLVAIALPDEPLTVIGDAHTELEKVGDRGEWLQVRLSDGVTTGYVAAWYVQIQPGQKLPPLLTVAPTEDMNMRDRPSTSGRVIRRLAANEPLTVRDDPARARPSIGKYDQWLYVATSTGQRGWVAAWYVKERPVSFAVGFAAPPPETGEPVVVYATEPLNVRSRPTGDASRIAVALPHEPLTSLEERWATLSKLEKFGEWLNVRLPDGKVGYVAARYTSTEAGPATFGLLTVSPNRNTVLRERPAVNARIVAEVMRGAALVVHDDPERAAALIGRYDEWLYVETAAGVRGWVVAWHVAKKA